jgi:PIN domain nuclease of toxin-antitoxin system
VNVLLDTHVWIGWLLPQAAITARERAALDLAAGRGELRVSAISLWEAQMLHAKGRLELPVPLPAWLQAAAAPDVVTVMPLDLDVVVALDALPASFHGDPADRLIVATARAHALPLATKDSRIRRSRLVRLWNADQRQAARTPARTVRGHPI